MYVMRYREKQLMAEQDDLSRQLENRRVELPSTEEIKAYATDFREFLKQGTIPERKALIRNFVKEIEVVGDQATLTYTIPMPSDGATKENASARYLANSGLLNVSVSSLRIRRNGNLASCRCRSGEAERLRSWPSEPIMMLLTRISRGQHRIGPPERNRR